MSSNEQFDCSPIRTRPEVKSGRMSRNGQNFPLKASSRAVHPQGTRRGKGWNEGGRCYTRSRLARKDGPLMPLAPDNPNNRSVASILLREGGVIAFPTDTVYGLGASAFNHAAVSMIFVIKNRSRDQGLPVLIASESQLPEVASEVPDSAYALAERFWPGGLTLVVPRNTQRSCARRSYGDTIAVRLPDHRAPDAGRPRKRSRARAPTATTAGAVERVESSGSSAPALSISGRRREPRRRSRPPIVDRHRTRRRCSAPAYHFGADADVCEVQARRASC